MLESQRTVASIQGQICPKNLSATPFEAAAHLFLARECQRICDLAFTVVVCNAVCEAVLARFKIASFRDVVSGIHSFEPAATLDITAMLLDAAPKLIPINAIVELGRIRALSLPEMPVASSFVSPPLGHSIPYSTPHAVSVSLPTWRDNVGYEEAEPRVVNAMQTGYPRFFVHKNIQNVRFSFPLQLSAFDAQLFPLTRPVLASSSLR